MARQDTLARRKAPTTNTEGYWEQLAESADPAVFCHAWLVLLSETLGGVGGGLVTLRSPSAAANFELAAWLPREGAPSDRLIATAKVVEHDGQRIAVKQPSKDGGERVHAGYPVVFGQALRAVVALDLDPRPDGQLALALRQLQWASSTMEVLFRRMAASQAPVPPAHLQAALETMAAVAGQERFQGAAFALVSSLASRFECDRVSVGFWHKGNVVVRALSNSAQFGKNSNLMRAIGSAMDEAADQQTIINYPMAPGSAAIVGMLAHEELARQHRNGSILTVPLTMVDTIVGALTLERAAPRPFEQSTIEVCQAVAALAGPLLEVLRRDDRWVGAKLWEATRTQLAHVIGAGHFALKLSLFALALLLSFLIFVKTDYRVSAKTLVEPITRRALVASLNGYIAEAPVRAGDRVTTGQLICRLDDRELKLEYSKWKSQEEQSTKQYYEALGGGNAAQVQVLRAQIDQASAQLRLVEEQLGHTRITAPFDGIVVSGDLSQQLGSPVELGKLLFEVAPLDAYRIALQVDERDIAEVAVGQRGHIVLSGFPHDPLPFSIEKITPVATAAEGRNFFRIEAKMQRGLARLRPGMEGVGKIEIEPRRWIWVLSHDVVDWLKLKIWQWLP